MQTANGLKQDNSASSKTLNLLNAEDAEVAEEILK